MKVVGIVPARLESTRLPGKVLLPIDGLPMVVKTVFSARKCGLLEKIVVGTDDISVYDCVKKHEIEVHMTSKKHESGTDRVHEVAEILGLEDEDIVINIQADEPFVSHDVIKRLIKCLSSNSSEMGTVAVTELNQHESNDENVVKTYSNKDQKAIDFTRKLKTEKNCYKHMGLYGYKMKTLRKFVNLDRSQSEVERKLEQMRALDNGISIDLVFTNKSFLSIDTKQDYEKAVKK